MSFEFRPIVWMKKAQLYILPLEKIQQKWTVSFQTHLAAPLSIKKEKTILAGSRFTVFFHKYPISSWQMW